MNILCVCGNGIGTSVLLKVNVESVAADLGVDVNVTTSDAGSAKGTANMNVCCGIGRCGDDVIPDYFADKGGKNNVVAARRRRADSRRRWSGVAGR